MDAALFTRMLSDKSILDLRKLGYKYPQADMKEFISLLETGFYKTLPLHDFSGKPVVYLAGTVQIKLSAVRLLMNPRDGGTFGLKAMEDEIISTFTIEQINTSRDSVRKILSGYAPIDESENRIFGMKKGLEFIAEPANQITEKNIHRLYQMTVGDFLPEEDRLLPNHLYRHDSVFVVGRKVEHTGLPWQKLPAYMETLVRFMNEDDGIHDLLKAALIHFYIAYLHPYFDGNGRMARLIHLWYLVQKGYPSALFVPLSGYVERSRNAYYNAYTMIENNAGISNVLDVTPFLVYFIENVYHKLNDMAPQSAAMDIFRTALEKGTITEKEKELWKFVLSAYGGGEFSTKQLERDFGNAAYATIRSFVLKFEQMGLLVSQKYGARIKYRLN